MSNELLQKPDRKQNVAVVAAGVALIGFVGFLLLANYRSQIDLQKSALDRLRLESQDRAAAVGHFFTDRENDVKNLVAGRPVSIFFENKALGMSMAYGLRASLLGITQRFNDVIEDRKLGADKIYTRIAFVGADGDLLVDTVLAENTGQVTGREWKQLLTPGNRSATIVHEHQEGWDGLLASVPYFFKGEYAGQIIAWINPRIVSEHFLKQNDSSSEFAYLVCYEHSLCLPGNMSLAECFSRLPDLVDIQPDAPLPFEAARRDGTKVAMIAVREPIVGASIFLVNAVPAAEVFGRTAPWHLLVAMGALSVVVLGGVMLVLRFHTRSLLLQTRLKKASHRREELEQAVRERTQEVQEQNSHLEEALAQLQQAHAQLLQAVKLESIGRLAAGIAHEINTPIQYVGDNIRFLFDSIKDLLGLVGAYRDLASECASGDCETSIADKTAMLESEADLPYLEEEIPKAVEQSLHGVERVSKIVLAMKGFAHPGEEKKNAADINQAIETTITISRNEWKYVAEIATDFDSSLPLVPCLVGEFNQVVLNLIVNAAHAIADVVGDGAASKGTITISTCRDGDWAEVRIRDTGTGIPEEHRSKVFDHFFTTKAVGKGTGQGLSIAYSVIAEKHGGTITFETEMGKGTTFIIRLPIEAEPAGTEETLLHEEAHSIR